MLRKYKKLRKLTKVFGSSKALSIKFFKENDFWQNSLLNYSNMLSKFSYLMCLISRCKSGRRTLVASTSLTIITWCTNCSIWSCLSLIPWHAILAFFSLPSIFTQITSCNFIACDKVPYYSYIITVIP